MNCVLVLGTLMLLSPAWVDATVTLRVQMVNYNTKERNWDGSWCDVLGGDCDAMFRFCLSKSTSSYTSCNFCSQCDHISPSSISNTNYISFGSNIGGINNPLVVNMNSWPGSFKLYVYVKDSDGGWSNADHIDTLQKTISGARVKSSSSLMTTLTIDGLRSSYKTRLTLKWYAYCDANFYGSACDVYCVAQNGAAGHYTCNSDTGAKVCRAGWETPTENCNVKINDCENHQCQNGGTCVDQYKSYTCSCKADYTGDKCQTKIDECTSQPCQNGAPCVVGVNKYTCTCSAGYGGVNCQTNINECASSPCKNGGQCVDKLNYYTCTCTGGYYGTHCENVDACHQNTQCKNGGTCKNAGNDFVCDCTTATNYWGQYCQVEKKCLSQSIVCQNGGTCIDSITGDWLCKCAGDFTGTHCQYDNPCLPNPCVHGQCTIGVANSVQGIVACNCDSGWTGNKCELDDPCLPNPCKNGGRCILTSFTTHRCECACDYMGADCSVLSPCYTNPCTNEGNCSVTSSVVSGNTVFSPSCACIPNHSGNTCQSGYCENQSPCTGGATCTSIIRSEVGAYTCTGGTSNTCAATTTVLDTCLSSPCENGGICTNKNNQYVCACAPGYSGLNCHINTDECSSNPCHNGGNCTDLVNAYNCTCPPDYNGTYCELFNECWGNGNCKNGAECMDVDGDYRCRCTPGFVGRHCEIELTCQTKPNPCKNGGTCVNDITSGISRCLCPSGYLGNHCDIISPCIPNPCVNNSECIVKDASTRAIACKLDNGTICQHTFVTTPCDVNPCQNGGGCSVNGSDYVCTCKRGYYGKNCDVSNPCANYNCDNLATCQVQEVMVNATNVTMGVMTYQPSCVCLSGFNGDTCSFGPCDHSYPCIHGSCTNTVMSGQASYYCDCDSGWQGQTCSDQASNSSQISGFSHQTGDTSLSSSSAATASTAVATMFAVGGIATIGGAATFYLVKKKRSSGVSGDNNTASDRDSSSSSAEPAAIPDNTAASSIPAVS